MNRNRSLLLTLAIAGWIATIGFTVAQAHNDDGPPAAGKIAFAQKVSDLMLNELVAALFTEFDETTPQNVEEGKHSISLIFNNRNDDMRLVGTFGPLQSHNRPSDSFERKAHNLALQGQPYTDVQQVDGQWYYRRSIPLSNFRAECAYCHTNFPAGPTSDWVGALMLRVPIE